MSTKNKSKSKDKFIQKLDEQKADIVIAHWAVFSPRKSGLYETTKELIQYENRMDNVIAGLIDPNNKKGGQADRSSDPHLVSQSHDWAFRDANIHMIHSSLTGISGRLEPNIFFMHGSPEACLWSELEPFDRGFSLSSAFTFMERSEAMIVFMKRHQYLWKHIAAEKVRLVTKGVDLERWKPEGMRMNLEGEPNILFGEVWRMIKDPFLTFFAMDELYKKLPTLRFHPWALASKRRLWNQVIGRAGFHKLLGQYQISGPQAYPEHWYRGGDMLVSPVITGEPSRVLQEALACGCPVIGWDCDNFNDSHAMKRAKPFDPRDLAQKCADLWEEIQSDGETVKRRARRIAETHFSMKQMAEQVVAIVREVLRKS